VHPDQFRTNEGQKNSVVDIELLRFLVRLQIRAPRPNRLIGKADIPPRNVNLSFRLLPIQKIIKYRVV